MLEPLGQDAAHEAPQEVMEELKDIEALEAASDESTMLSAPSEQPLGPRVSADMKRLLGTSIIKEIGVEERFKQLAALVGQSTRFSSSSTVVLNKVTHKYTVGEEAKAFPTVGEVLADPFIKVGKRLRRALSKEEAAGRSSRAKRELYALRDVSTVLEPSRLYLVIGGPKSGKTSLLRAIAGRPPNGRNVTVSGAVLYNGERAEKDAGFNITHVACYVEETDNNEPLLTVRETLEFAGTCILPVPTKRLTKTPYWQLMVEKLELDDATKAELLAGKNVGSLKARRAMAKERAKVVMSLLGLAGCSETIIGDHTHRGVSGGERRRVTLAEVVMGEYSVACFDEISNGLDSAATFDIIDMLRASVHHYQYTCAVALNQPAPEVYDLFDEVIVLKSGQIAYQGPPGEAKDHFESLGFRCPPSMDLADFLVGVMGKAGTNKKLVANRSELAESGLTLASVPTTTSEFAQRFRRSTRGRSCLAAVEAVASSIGDGEHKTQWRENERMRFYNGWWTSLRVCMEREVALTLRDKSYIGARLLQDVLLGLLTGLIFFNLNLEAVSTRFGAMYQTLLTIAFQTAACVPAYFTHRRVFYKQKAAGFFSCSSYLVASTLAAAPLVLLDSAIFGTIVYWCMGFARDDGGLRFFIFLAHLTLLGWAMMCFFKLTTFLCPDLTTSAGLSGVITFFLLLFSGFVMAIKDVPNYYLPVLYSNPIFWCFQALACNEFLSEKYSAPLPGGNGKTMGQTILGQKGLHSHSYWVWYGLLANAGITLVYLLATWLAMRTIEHHEPVSADASPEEAMSSLFSAASLRQPGLARREVPSWDGRSSETSTGGHSNTSVVSTSGRSLVGGGVRQSIPEDEELKAGDGAEGFDDDGVSDFGDGEAEPGDGSTYASSSDAPAPARVVNPAGVTFMSAPSSAPTVSTLSHQTQQGSSASVSDGSVSIGSAPSLRGAMRQGSSHWQLQAVSAIPFVPCALSFEEVRYAVPNPKGRNGEMLELLKGVSGFVTPGTMMALMGSSGAGKTTLLDVLAGRKTGGAIHGDILVNGAKLDPGVFKAIVGYVEQFGCISPYMTVAEVLHFNAELRLPASVDPATRRQFVADVLRLLELTSISDSVVGPPGGGLSFEELKRVTIGAEVVANPSLIFLDEPTTGLDARAAMIVVRVLRKLAQTGRAIICTIHQPSKEIFQNFDSLLLLKKGGLTVYCGPLGEKAQTLIDYFEEIPGTPKISPGENPSSWMLECLGAGTGLGEEKADYVAAWRKSPQSAYNLTELHDVVARAHEEQGESMTALRSRIRARFLPQLRACILRAARASWRMPEYQLARIGGTGGLGLALGSLYWNMSQTTVSGLVSFIALIFLATTFVSSINATSVLQMVALEKPSFARERFNRMYNVMAYVGAAFLVEVPWVLLQSLVYMGTFYTTCGYSPEAWRVVWFFAFSFLYMLFSTAFGQAVGAVCPSVQVAQIALNCVLPIFSMMSGMTIIPIDLPKAWKPLWVITPMNKAFEGLVTTQWGLDATGQIGYFSMRKKQFLVLTKEAFVKEFFGSFEFTHRWRDLGVLFGFIFACNVGFYLALKYRKLENR